eukprot:9189204-Alexandrium_andersonii.AAC.1
MPRGAMPCCGLAARPAWSVRRDPGASPSRAAERACWTDDLAGGARGGPHLRGVVQIPGRCANGERESQA